MVSKDIKGLQQGFSSAHTTAANSDDGAANDVNFFFFIF